MTNKFLTIFIATHLIFTVTLFLLDYKIFLLNFEISFFIALLIIFSSYKSYKKMINRNSIYPKQNLNNLQDEPIIKEHGFKTIFKMSPSYLSWKRLGSYALLILTFILLKNSEMLNITAYFLGLTSGILVVLIAGFKFISLSNK